MITPEDFKDRRQELDMTQQELADRAELSKSTISRFENGQMALSIQTTLLLGSILGFKPDELREFSTKKD